MRTLLLAAALGALTGCEPVPSYVETSDIDNAMAMGRYKSVCVGLRMKDPDVRAYAARKFIEVQDPIAAECVCEHLTDPGTGKVDLDILKGLRDAKRDDLVACVLPALDNPDSADPVEFVATLARTRAPAALARLGELARDAARPTEVRTQALAAFSGKAEPEAVALITSLLDDKDAAVRAAAASALVGQKDPELLARLTRMAKEDPEGEVRAAAIEVVRKAGGDEVEALMCAAMMDDASPAVRRAAIGAFKGTKSKSKIDCLRRRAFALEEDAGVREALISTLKGTPEAHGLLCESIPFFMKSYVDDKHPSDTPGTDVVKAQNDVDWDNSYACYQRALANRAGWSCKAHQYVAHYFREVGGSTFVPKCAGDGGAGVISFE